MDAIDLADRYRAYIGALNRRRLDLLEEWVCDELTYNREPMTRAQYRELLAGDFAAIPDLFFTIDRLVVAQDQVACRLTFECTPEQECLGLRPTGRSISFAEHVFYAFDRGRIHDVWSLLDRQAIETQLRGGC